MAGIPKLLEGLKSKKCPEREKCFKPLLKLSGKNPGILYPKWDLFANDLDAENVFHRYQAVYLIAGLAKNDRKKKFEKIFDKYFKLLNDRSIVVAAHVALNAGKIAKSKPRLEGKITKRLLATDKSKHKRKIIIQAYAMEALSTYFDKAKDKKNILKFAKKQLKIGNPKAKKAAKEILKN